MLKILGRNIKKSISLFLIFFVISLFFSITIYYIENTRQFVTMSNEFFSEKSIQVLITGGDNGNDKITGAEFINAVSKLNGIILGKNITIDKGSNQYIYGTEIYFNESCFNNPPTLLGRFFNAGDFKSNEPVALVGKNLQGILISKDNKRFLFYDDTYYKVIGIMGYKDKSSIYDNRFVVNLNSSIADPLKFSRDLDNPILWRLDNKNSNERESIKNLYNSLSKINKNVQIQIMNQNSRFTPLTMALKVNKSLITALIIFILVLFLNIMNVSLFWVSEMKKEIGVRKALGGTNRSIALRIILKYEIIGIAAACMALLTHLALSKYTNFIEMFSIYSDNTGVSLISITALIVFSFIIGLAVSFIPISKILKMETNDIIRGR